MSWVRIDLTGGRTGYRPGEELTGTVSWSIDPGGEPVEAAEAHLLWFTRGKGDRNTEVVVTERLEGAPSRSDRRDFRFRLPAGPYSVSGKLVSIVWAVEVVLDPGARAERIEITVSPTGREVLLHSDLDGGSADLDAGSADLDAGSADPEEAPGESGSLDDLWSGGGGFAERE